MKKRLIIGSLILFATIAGARWAYTQPPAKEKTAEIPAAEKPFWASAQAFADAYAKRDAVAIGELFTEDAEFFDEFGVRTEGRKQIVEMYREVFKSSPEALIDEIMIERIRSLSKNVTLEEGYVVASESAGGPKFRNRYVAMHTLGEDGVWRINTLKDYPRAPGGRREQLAQLEWMLGEWVDQNAASISHTTCMWSDDENFLIRKFNIQTFDGQEFRGEQRIGWDAAANKIRSWTFDAQGGFLNGIWTRDGNTWIVNTEGVNAEGLKVVGTSVYTMVDSEMIRWQNSQMIVGDEVRPSGRTVTMVRRPPAPKLGSK